MKTNQKKSVRTLLVIMLCCAFTPAAAQRIAIKTNALQWATLSPNLGVQLFLSDRISLDLSAGGNPFTIGQYKLNYLMVEPEVRYWFGRPLTGHTAGITLPYVDNDLGLNGTRYKGQVFGIGATYGYYWVLGRRWSMGVTAGLGMARYRQFKYKSDDPAGRPAEPNLCGWTAAPLNLSCSFSYILR